jgi:uncharacterized protein YcbK (DUF882 family)
MKFDVLSQLDRRGFLAAVASAVASSAGPAFGQTLIQDTPSSDVGFAREKLDTGGEGVPGHAVPQQVVREAGKPTQAPEIADWRKFLISGERSILMRRDGAAQRVRYATSDGQLDRQGYGMACLLLRDVRAGKVYPMDPRLLDILCGLQRWAEYNGRTAVIQVLSGFRTPATNNSVEGAALRSMHLHGRAADIVFEGMSSGLLGAMVRSYNNQGGTGIYLNRGFVHVDTGAARSWVSTERSKRR